MNTIVPIPISDWRFAETEIERVISEDVEPPFAAETIAEARQFLEIVRDRCPVPDDVSKGYWSTVIINWPTKPHGFQVEIFEDRIETYRFYDGHTDIRSFAHAPEEPFPPDLLAELPVL
jgi:hypothetical protein